MRGCRGNREEQDRGEEMCDPRGERGSQERKIEEVLGEEDPKTDGEGETDGARCGLDGWACSYVLCRCSTGHWRGDGDGWKGGVASAVATINIPSGLRKRGAGTALLHCLFFCGRSAVAWRRRKGLASAWPLLGADSWERAWGAMAGIGGVYGVFGKACLVAAILSCAASSVSCALTCLSYSSSASQFFSVR